MTEPQILVLSTDEIRRQVHSNLMRPQTRISIVTPFLQDVDFGSTWSLQKLVAAQTRGSAVVELITTAPSSASRSEFKRKYLLLERLRQVGVEITFNRHLHAKAFCFNREGALFVTMVGSANLTGPGMRDHLELAVFSAREGIYHSVMAHVRLFMRHRDSLPFAAWKSHEKAQIDGALRGTPDDN